MLKKYLSIFFLFLITLCSFAQSDVIPEKPNPERLVNNFSSSGFLNEPEINALEQKLQAFSNQTSNQIVIVIVDDLGDLEPWDFATQLGRKWGVGQAKMDNGIVILIKPTGGKNQRKVHIAVGTGLEGAIPDITCKQIVEHEIIPQFKKQNNYEALEKATDVLMALAKGEYNSDEYAAKNKKNDWLTGLIIMAAILIFIFITSKRGGGGGGFGTGFFLGSMFSGGGHGGGSSDSGGFGGFGGGDFGGGGSGGSW